MALVPYTGGAVGDRLADLIVDNVHGAAGAVFRALYNSARSSIGDWEWGAGTQRTYDTIDSNRRLIGLGPVNRTRVSSSPGVSRSLPAAYYGSSRFRRRRVRYRRRRRFVYRGLRRFYRMRRRGLTAGAYYPKFF